ncbi:MAG: hypothetical protein HY744_28475 [Deltaproteobacteria bacterium]|nr:hypothetical protein [Deltaproteobacteria bacterium]
MAPSAAWLLAVAGLLAAFDARAQQPRQEPDWGNAPRERRSGLVVGLGLGGALGGASGYPNDAMKIDREQYHTVIGVAAGGGGSLWLGAAPCDWLTLGLGGSGGVMEGEGHQVAFFAGALRLEAFPAWSLGGYYRELGTFMESGIGFVEARAEGGGTVLPIDSGGAASRLGVGVFYEGIRLWRLSMGPYAMFDEMWSASASRPALWLGWRTALYTGP